MQRKHHILTVLLAGLIPFLYAIADDYRMVVYRAGLVESIPTDSVAHVAISEDNIVVHQPSGRSFPIPFPIDSITFPDSSHNAFSGTSPDTFEGHSSHDTLSIYWHAEIGAKVFNPQKTEGVDVTVCGGHVEIVSHRAERITLLAAGQSSDGSLFINAQGEIDLILDSLSLSNPRGGSITLCSDNNSVITLLHTNTLSDGMQRDSIISEIQQACLTSSGELQLRGAGRLNIAGNFKHAVYGEKKLGINDCFITVDSACADGIRAKKKMTIEEARIETRKTGKNVIKSDKSSISIQNSSISISLQAANAKGISAKKGITCSGSQLELNLLAKASKGLKSDGDILLLNDTLTAYATGGVAITGEDKTYCSVVKSGSCLTLDGCLATVRHDGIGGKGFCSDSTFTLVNSQIDMQLTGYGAPYLVNQGLDLDFFTPRCLESKQDMHIVSGRYNLRATGKGGKGIVCDNTLIIGKVSAEDSLLWINVTTEGTAVIDDIFTDQRFGCPKAIKAGQKLVVESGFVCTRTMGMGGEGLESKGTLTINGGTLVCESFDDGINVEEGITVNGGRIYATSFDNDGIDSNGFIALNGGVVASLTSHERDEDFDCDDNRFCLRGGIICGIGRDYSGIFEVGQPYIQHIALVRDKENFRVDTIAAYDIPKDTYITFCDSQERPVMTVLVHDNIPAAFTTMSSAGMKAGSETKVYLTDTPPAKAKPLIEGKIWLGGEPFDTTPLFCDKATLLPYDPPVVSKNPSIATDSEPKPNTCKQTYYYNLNSKTL